MSEFSWSCLFASLVIACLCVAGVKCSQQQAFEFTECVKNHAPLECRAGVVRN